MKVYLTDSKTYQQYTLGKNQSDIQVLLTLKKIIPSIMELMLPILPDEQVENKIEQMTWESTQENFHLFQLLYQSWGVVELRLKALKQYKSEQFVHQLLLKAHDYRQKVYQQHHYRLIELDYLFFLFLHTMIDSELINLGESFYVPSFKQQWKQDMGHIKEPIVV